MAKSILSILNHLKQWKNCLNGLEQQDGNLSTPTVLQERLANESFVLDIRRGLNKTMADMAFGQLITQVEYFYSK